MKPKKPPISQRLNTYLEQPMEYIRKSLKRLSKTICPIERFTILDNVAEAKTTLGNYEGAIKTSIRTESIATTINDEILYCKSLFSRALSFLWFGQINRAAKITHKCLEIGERNNSKSMKCKCMLLLARIDMLKGYAERSKLTLDRAMEIAGQLGNIDLTNAGKLLQCELLISTNNLKKAVKLAEAALFRGEEEKTGPLLNELRALLGGLYLSQNKLIKSLDLLSFHRQFSRHSMGWGLNPKLRLACVHIQANQMEEAESIFKKVNRKSLPVHERLLLLRIEMKIARSKCEHSRFTSLLTENKALQVQTEKEIIDYGNIQAKLLGVAEDTLFSRLIQNSGTSLLTEEENKNLNPDNYSLFYNGLTGKLYSHGKLIKTFSPNGQKGTLLTMLMKNNGKYYTNREIYEQIWKNRFNHEFNDNNVYVTMSKLRKTLKDTKTRRHWQFVKSSKAGAYAFDPGCQTQWAILIPVRE